MLRTVLTCPLLLFSFAALAQRGIEASAKAGRIALVIGNGTYRTGPLHNPVHDANDMAGNVWE